METTFTPEDRRRIKAGIGEKYRKVAISPEGAFKYPTGRAGLEGQSYDRRSPRHCLKMSLPLIAVSGIRSPSARSGRVSHPGYRLRRRGGYDCGCHYGRS